MINPRKNGFTAGEIFVTPFRLSVDRQSTIFSTVKLVILCIKNAYFHIVLWEMIFSGGISNLVRENELLFIVTSPDLESHKCKRVTDFLKNNFILERRRICCISNVNGIMALMKKRCSCRLSQENLPINFNYRTLQRCIRSVT